MQKKNITRTKILLTHFLKFKIFRKHPDVYILHLYVFRTEYFTRDFKKIVKQFFCKT